MRPNHSLGCYHFIPMCLPDCSALISRHDWSVLIHYSAKELILITRSGINHQFAVWTDTSDLNRWIHSDKYDRSFKFVTKHHKKHQIFIRMALFIRNLQTLLQASLQLLICKMLNNVGFLPCWEGNELCFLFPREKVHGSGISN